MTMLNTLTHIEKLIAEIGALDADVARRAKLFGITIERSKSIPNVACFQMGLKGVIKAAIAAGVVEDGEFKLLPSWAKFNANPAEGKGFFVRMLQAIFLGLHGHSEVNMSKQAAKYEDLDAKSRVAMMFFGAISNANLDYVAKYAQDALGKEWKIVKLHGGTKTKNGKAKKNMILGKRVNNKEAQGIVKDIVAEAEENGENVLILASNMAQRSFSVGAISELYLAYDNGQLGATIQKMSRALTPNGDSEKVGRIVSLAFDIEKDDKFDAMIMQTAVNMAKKTKKPLGDSLKDVCATLDIFNCTENGAVKIDADAYLLQAMERKAISRVVGKMINFNNVPMSVVTALASGDGEVSTLVAPEAAPKGKTTDEPAKKSAAKELTEDQQAAKDIDKMMAKAREQVVVITERMYQVLSGTNTTTVTDAIAAVKGNDALVTSVEKALGVSVDAVLYLFEHKIINTEMVELVVQTSKAAKGVENAGRAERRAARRAARKA
jgi:hypothetical protein